MLYIFNLANHRIGRHCHSSRHRHRQLDSAIPHLMERNRFLLLVVAAAVPGVQKIERVHLLEGAHHYAVAAAAAEIVVEERNYYYHPHHRDCPFFLFDGHCLESQNGYHHVVDVVAVAKDDVPTDPSSSSSVSSFGGKQSASTTSIVSRKQTEMGIAPVNALNCTCTVRNSDNVLISSGRVPRKKFAATSRRKRLDNSNSESGSVPVS
mmetsp:Transcript_2107/g.2381  ORF Transcript_2107/g.2381 Transcript_2107/m.2381 type:complete len:208 (+) Transcript_2107:181-804(+)